MEMSLNIPIEKVVTKLKIATNRADNIKAFGELWFYPIEQSEPLFKAKGFTIKLITLKESGNKVLTVNSPAYGSPKSKTGFQTSFIIEDKELLKNIRHLFLQEFEQVSGGLNAEELVRSESEDFNDAELDKIAFEIDKQTES